MKFMKDTGVFIANDIKRLKRKWLSLPLLFILPILFIVALIFLLSNLVSEETDVDITIGLVNLDENDMTKTLVDSLSEETDLTKGLSMESMSIEDAEEKIENDKISAFIVFPANFAENMMAGKKSDLEVTGNPKRQFESYVISSAVDTLIRHIRNSQSNILTLNHYAKEFGMNDDERHDLIFKEFVNQFIQVLSSDTLMDEDEKSQNFTSGNAYLVVNGLFIVFTVWVYMLHVMLMKDTPSGIQDRMKMLRVSLLSEGLGRVISIFIAIIIPILLVLGLSIYMLDIPLTLDNILRVISLLILHILITVVLLNLVDWLSLSVRISLITQSLVILFIVIFSGSLIPRIYFPTYLDKIFDYFYGYQSLNWLEEIMLNGRFTMEIDVLMVTLVIVIILMIIISYIKGRRFT